MNVGYRTTTGQFGCSPMTHSRRAPSRPDGSEPSRRRRSRHPRSQIDNPADLDRNHGTALRHRHRCAVLMTIICTVAAEYIRYFQPRAIHFPPSPYKYRIADPQLFIGLERRSSQNSQRKLFFYSQSIELAKSRFRISLGRVALWLRTFVLAIVMRASYPMNYQHEVVAKALD